MNLMVLLLAPEDDIQGIDIEVDAQQQDESSRPRHVSEGRVVVEPQREDSILGQWGDAYNSTVRWPICVLLVQHMVFRVQEAKQSVSSV